MGVKATPKALFFVCLFVGLFLFFFCLFRAAPEAHGDPQAKCLIGATAASLHHSHSNAGLEPHL